MWRIAVRALVALGIVLTGVCLLLLVATWRDDLAIGSHSARTTADVLSVASNRTVVRFSTPDGVVHIPSEGVLYPQGLRVGDKVWVQYDTTNTDLVKVAGRGFSLALLPIGTVILVTWIVLAPLLWWLRRTRAATERETDRTAVTT